MLVHKHTGEFHRSNKKPQYLQLQFRRYRRIPIDNVKGCAQWRIGIALHRQL